MDFPWSGLTWAGKAWVVALLGIFWYPMISRIQVAIWGMNPKGSQWTYMTNMNAIGIGITFGALIIALGVLIPLMVVPDRTPGFEVIIQDDDQQGGQ